MKKILKKPMFTFILGAIIFGSVGVYAATQYTASQITYNKNGKATVDAALNDLYSKKTIDSSKMFYQESYSNLFYDSTSLDLAKGDYLCNYTTSHPGYTLISNANKRLEQDSRISITGCDSEEKLYGKKYYTTGKTTFESSFIYELFNENAVFNCHLNSNKTLTITFNGDNNNTRNPVSSNLFCIKTN